jgi:hypothetical protein
MSDGQRADEIASLPPSREFEDVALEFFEAVRRMLLTTKHPRLQVPFTPCALFFVAISKCETSHPNILAIQWAGPQQVGKTRTNAPSTGDLRPTEGARWRSGREARNIAVVHLCGIVLSSTLQSRGQN